MLQCIFILSDSGEVMLEKQWMGKRVDRSICTWFWTQARSSNYDEHSVPSVLASPTYYLMNIVRDGITFLACTESEMPPLLGIEFLCRVADVLADYLGGINEDLIKDNFVIVYEVLDEMMDGGFPSTTEPNVLKELIAPPNLVSRVLSVVTGASSSLNNTLPLAMGSKVPWRGDGIKHSNNEIYFDLVEEMDAVLNRDGFLIKGEVYGEIHANCRLSGMPEVSLSFSNPAILNDISFHPCVRYKVWESNRVLSFLPPDGAFKLTSYRVKGLKSTPVYVRPQLTFSEGICHVNVMLGIRNDPGKPVDSIVVQLPWPSTITSVDLTANHGTVTQNHGTKVSTWSVGRIPRDKSPCLTGTLKLQPGLTKLPHYPTLLVGFKIMGATLSGLKVDKMDLQGESYRPHKGFRAVTRAGNYEIRT
ncbi:hypothetical protein O6H91_17G054100 [Diphasiastrum complanatum]|uniref:Uncharacterized protein n=1 Tax=Diphasiastrum complanatum TaxID=34168 RepID=A0ACC2B815_DIPCM|nr:hypothetical protein O6H91_17G054100 [Diphasiastrum complanatum]